MRIFTTASWTLLLQVLLSLIFAHTAKVTAEESETPAVDYFYLNDKTVLEFLDDTENGGQKNWFMNQSGPRVVEFYSPLCPACDEFRPHYIKLAEDTTRILLVRRRLVRRWTRVVVALRRGDF